MSRHSARSKLGLLPCRDFFPGAILGFGHVETLLLATGERRATGVFVE